jgi:hypothetical protein
LVQAKSDTSFIIALRYKIYNGQIDIHTQDIQTGTHVHNHWYGWTRCLHIVIPDAAVFRTTFDSQKRELVFFIVLHVGIGETLDRRQLQNDLDWRLRRSQRGDQPFGSYVLVVITRLESGDWSMGWVLTRFYERCAGSCTSLSTKECSGV